VTGSTFDDLLAEGLMAPFSGWDFSFLRGRTETAPLPWSYAARIAVLVGSVAAKPARPLPGGPVCADLLPAGDQLLLSRA
jgi:hypothetical protein